MKLSLIFVACFIYLALGQNSILINPSYIHQVCTLDLYRSYCFYGALDFLTKPKGQTYTTEPLYEGRRNKKPGLPKPRPALYEKLQNFIASQKLEKETVATITYASTITLTLPSTKTCVALEQFAGFPKSPSTTACRRKRGFVPEILEPGIEHTTKRIEPTRMVDAPNDRHIRDIESSIETDYQQFDDHVLARSKFGYLGSILNDRSTTTVTTTITLPVDYHFTHTPVTKKVDLGIKPGMLACLPPGFMVC